MQGTVSIIRIEGVSLTRESIIIINFEAGSINLEFCHYAWFNRKHEAFYATRKLAATSGIKYLQFLKVMQMDVTLFLKRIYIRI